MSLLSKKETKSWSKEALSYLNRAKNGDDAGQYELGLRLLRGEGVPENVKSAVDWLIKSANQGNEDAQYLLGHCYETGTGVTENANVSLGYYLKSAEAANKYAQKALGDHYFYEEKYNTAMDWYLKSAKQNLADAQFCVARGYYYGFGNVKSEKEAIYWLERASDFGHKEAIKMLQKLEENCLPTLL